METPSSTRRVTRSQTRVAAMNNNIIDNNPAPVSKKSDDSESGVSRRRNGKQQQQDRSALIDITNDSPIVGLAMGSLETPSSAMTKQRSSRACNASTPGSGEALLRGQVKTLLQKVEEEAELSKLSLENRPFLRLQGFVSSPGGLLAPTPANTPQIPDLSEDGSVNGNESDSAFNPLPVTEEQLKICQVVSDIFNGIREEGSIESQKSLNRKLLLDFSEKSESSDSSECSSVLSFQGVSSSGSKDKSPSTDDDNASIWSIQVNASARDEDEEQVLEEKENEVEEGSDGDLVDDLCDGIGKMSVNEKPLPKFTGKHIRFEYNSEDEMVEVLESAPSPSVLHLKGLPTPKGKHVRFPAEEEEDQGECSG